MTENAYKLEANKKQGGLTEVHSGGADPSTNRWSEIASTIHERSNVRGHFSPQPVSGDKAEALKLEHMITSGDATGLNQELKTRNNDNGELTRALKIVHDDLKSQGLDVNTSMKYGKPSVSVETENGKTSIEFNNPFSIGNVPMVGTHEGHFREYHQGFGQASDANQGLRNVLAEAEANRNNPPTPQIDFETLRRSWNTQDPQHPDWHIKGLGVGVGMGEAGANLDRKQTPQVDMEALRRSWNKQDPQHPDWHVK